MIKKNNNLKISYGGWLHIDSVKNRKVRAIDGVTLRGGRGLWQRGDKGRVGSSEGGTNPGLMGRGGGFKATVPYKERAKG